MIRRNAHAAGRSWRKWDDPIVYRYDSLLVWTWAIAIGAWAGIIASIGVVGISVLALALLIAGIAAMALEP